MAVLDTSFLIDILRGNGRAKNIMHDVERESLLACGAPSVMELWLGVLQSKLSGKEQERVSALLESINIFPLDERSAKEAASIEHEMMQRGDRMQVEDLMIAGIARSRGEQVVTNDAGFARVRGLKVLKY